MTCETPTIRPLRRTDFPALEELIRLAWYDDGNDSHNTHDEVGQTSGPDKHRAELRKATRLRTCIDLPQSTCRIAWPAPPKHTCQ